MIKYRPLASPVTQICISLHFSSLISGPRTVKFLFLIASCLQNTDVGGIYQVIAIKTKNIQQGPNKSKERNWFNLYIFLIWSSSRWECCDRSLILRWSFLLTRDGDTIWAQSWPGWANNTKIIMPLMSIFWTSVSYHRDLMEWALANNHRWRLSYVSVFSLQWQWRESTPNMRKVDDI